VVTNAGTYLFNGSTATLPQIQQKLTDAKAADPEVPVVIRGDSQTQYQAVMDVVALAGSLGISEVGLATKPGK
jgi:biopolymer transport protein ExbD